MQIRSLCRALIYTASIAKRLSVCLVWEFWSSKSRAGQILYLFVFTLPNCYVHINYVKKKRK